MVAASADVAVANANRYTSCPVGMCLKYTRTWLEIPARYGRAIDAWNNAAHRHPGVRTVPRGAPMFWVGGSSGAGHIALSTGPLSQGVQGVRSTDVPTSRHVSTVPLSWFAGHWPGLRYLGWSEDLNGVWIPYLRRAPVVTPPPARVTVSLSKVQAAARRDPGLPTGGKTFPTHVLPVEKGLVAEGLLVAQYADGSYGTKTVTAYQGWQHRLGYTGADADGIPGMSSLSKLGAKHGFSVVA